MNDYIIDIIVRTIATVILAIAAIVFNALRNSKNAKLKAAAEKIAAVVERLYDGYPPEKKQEAFEMICDEQKLNVNKCVKYLKETIIPISKSINVSIPTALLDNAEKKDEKNEDFI